MRSAIKLAYSMGSVAVILSGAALSAPPPIGFGQYTPGATLTANPCPTTVTCSTSPILGNGFLQREITNNADGLKYIQTIIDDGKGFKSEDFVRFNSTNSGAAKGIASKSQITEGGVAGAPAFTTGATLSAGWAASGTNSSEIDLVFKLDLKETVVGKNDGFLTAFNASVISPAGATVNTVTKLAIDQTVGLEVGTDRQRFYTAIQPAKTAVTAFKFPNAATNTPSVTYAVADPIQFLWVGQQVAGGGAFSTMTLAQAKADGSGVATFVTDTTTATPVFPAAITAEFFPTGGPAAPIF